MKYYMTVSSDPLNEPLIKAYTKENKKDFKYFIKYSAKKVCKDKDYIRLYIVETNISAFSNCDFYDFKPKDNDHGYFCNEDNNDDLLYIFTRI